MGALARCVLACALLTACGPAPPQPASAAKAGPTVDTLVAADAPSTLAIVVRIRSPERTLDRVTGWLGEGRDWKTLLTADDPAMAARLALTDSADLALGVDADGGEPWGAFSVGLQPDVELTEQSGCRRLGATRAVCGESEAATAALGPFLAKLATTEPAHDIEALLTRHGLDTLLRRPFESGLSEGAQQRAGSEPILRELVNGLVTEAKLVLDDIESVRAHADVGDERAGVELAAHIQLSSTQAWSWSTLMERSPQSGPPPDIFWRLPRDANATYFWRGLSASKLAPIVDFGERLLVELLRDAGAPPQFRQQARELFTLLAVLDATYASARGYDRRDFRVEVPTSPNAQTTREVTIAMPLQWVIAVVEEDAARYQQLLNKSAALLQTTYLRKAIEDRFGKGSVPKVRLRPLGCAAPSGGSLRGTLATVDLPPDLVAATSDHEERQMVGDIARQLARQGLLQFFVAVAAHGGQTWLVSSFDEKRVCALLTEATKVDPSAGTTRLGAARAELPLLTKAPALLGGFTSIGAILTGDSDVGSIEAVEALPFGGRTPIPFLVTAESAGPAATLHAEMWFAEGAVRDLPGALSSLREQEE